MTASADHQQPRLAAAATAATAAAAGGRWVDDEPDRLGRELPSEQTDGRVGLARAARAQQQAHALAAQSDVLLLQEGARRIAAQVSHQQPFGVPAQPSTRRSPLRHGFTWTIGALLALTVGLAARTVEHQLLLIVLAAFIAIGLDPAVEFLVGKGLRRAFAVTVIALLALACVAGFVAAAAPPLAKQASQLGSAAAAPSISAQRVFQVEVTTSYLE